MGFNEMTEEAASMVAHRPEWRDRHLARQSVRNDGSGNQEATGRGATAQAQNGHAIVRSRNVRVRTDNGHRQFNFGTGGIVSILLAGAALGSGATVAVTRTPDSLVTVSEAAGTWEPGGSQFVTGAMSTSEGPITMTVSRGGAFLFSTDYRISLPTAPVTDEKIRCSGQVIAQGNHLAFTAMSGACQDFNTTLSASQNIMTITSPVAKGQETALSKTG